MQYPYYTHNSCKRADQMHTAATATAATTAITTAAATAAATAAITTAAVYGNTD
jgi:hypothetical protein